MVNLMETLGPSVCYCIWRKRVYVIANEGFGLGDGTGPAKESKRTRVEHLDGSDSSQVDSSLLPTFS